MKLPLGPNVASKSRRSPMVVIGVWGMVYGVWCMVYGVWCTSMLCVVCGVVLSLLLYPYYLICYAADSAVRTPRIYWYSTIPTHSYPQIEDPQLIGHLHASGQTIYKCLSAPETSKTYQKNARYTFIQIEQIYWLLSRNWLGLSRQIQLLSQRR